MKNFPSWINEKWVICARETGDPIDSCATYEEAEQKVAAFEAEDVAEGNLTRRFYDIVENTMTVYVARSANGNTDTYQVLSTIEEARAVARTLYNYLTARERKTNTVSVETYTVPAEDGMTATEAYNEALMNGEITDPEDYETITEA